MKREPVVFAVAGMVFGFVLGYIKKALFNKGIALMQTGNRTEAVAVWEGLIKRFPDDPQLRELRGQIERIKAGKAS